MFVANAEEVLEVLGHDVSPEAEAMRREARALLEFFRSWPTLKPKSEDRVQAITQLMDLTTRAMAWQRARPHR